MFDEEPGRDSHEQCRDEIEKLEKRIKVLEDALKEWKDERCEDPTRIEVVPTEYRAEWKLYDCGKCRACKARAALEVKP